MKKYTSSIKSMPFLFLEAKRTALLLVQGRTPDEIIALSETDNIYQLNKEQRRRELPQKMLARLATLNQELIEVIANGNDTDAKLVAFYAMMKADRLLFEYMAEVVADKFERGITVLCDRDYIDFIHRKADSDDTVAKWTDSNLVKIRATIKSTLISAGLAKKDGADLELLPPSADGDLLRMFHHEDDLYKKAIMLQN